MILVKKKLFSFLRIKKTSIQEKEKLCIKNDIEVVPVYAEYQEEISVVTERGRNDWLKVTSPMPRPCRKR